ncbi:MAG: glycosyltransferase family 25 protein, partial [Nitrosomonadaceae bacterium]|nr:glycosyltransferase family 25 protein [Nitrosomonadaceae bacterium]
MKKLEANPAMCGKIAATPLLDETKKQMALQTISAMSRRLLQLAAQTMQKQQQTQPTMLAIDKTYMINLDSRPDRLESFMKTHPDMTFTRIPAVYGKTLQMSKTLYELCKHNTFQWKKSVIACGLSHISVWNKIVQGDATYTLIIEDDVRFNHGWLNHVKDIPEDAELVYLGGVLPSNRVVLPYALEKVNEYWSKIAPNQFFSKEPLPLFHFCAYSYLLTKRGAQKLLDYLEHSVDKFCIPVDHLIGHPVIGLTKYVANTLLTTCFQEEDQQYNNASFNDLQTEKKFDSDIYNHTECFDVSVYETPKTESVMVYYLSKDEPVLYEQKWLEDIFCRPIVFCKYEGTLKENAWCLLQRPYIQEWTTILATQ